jgi:formamidopyrimidine-DNA glycosylase
MPELPEVETSRRDLEREIVGRRIERVRVAKTQKLRGQSADEVQDRLQSQTIERVGRRGKFLFLDLTSGDSLVIHRGMTGNFRLGRPEEPIEAHLHLLLGLDDGRELRLVDHRGFGEVRLVSPEQRMARDASLGPEPLGSDFTVDYLELAFRKRTAPVKALLLNQAIVAGLGNIYVDESLFAARLHPLRTAGGLSREEIARLRGAIISILNRSIELRGSTFSDALTLYNLPGDYAAELRVFHRFQEPCPVCGEVIQRMVVAGRGTSYCPSCQPSPRTPSDGPSIAS